MNKFASQVRESAEPSLMSKIEEHHPGKKRHVGIIDNFVVFGIKDGSIKQQLAEGLQSN